MTSAHTQKESISPNDDRSSRAATPFSSLGAMQPPPSRPLPPTPWQIVKDISGSPSTVPAVGTRQLVSYKTPSKTSHSSNGSSFKLSKTYDGSLGSRKDSSPSISPLIEAVRAKFENGQQQKDISRQRPLSFTGRGAVRGMSVPDDQFTASEEDSVAIGSLKPIISELEDKHKLERTESSILTPKKSRRNPTSFQQELQKHNQRKFSESNPDAASSSMKPQRPRSLSQPNTLSRELIPSQIRTSKYGLDTTSSNDNHASTTLLSTDFHYGITAQVIEVLNRHTSDAQDLQSSLPVDDCNPFENSNDQNGEDSVIKNFSFNPPIPSYPTGTNETFARLRPSSRSTGLDSHFSDFDLDDYISKSDGASRDSGGYSRSVASFHFSPSPHTQDTYPEERSLIRRFSSSKIDQHSASYTATNLEVRSQSALAVYASDSQTIPWGLPSTFSSDHLVQSLRSLSRLSGLSHVNGAAFLITQSENSASGTGSGSGKSFSIEHLVEAQEDVGDAALACVGEVSKRRPKIPDISLQVEEPDDAEQSLDKGKQRASSRRHSAMSDDGLAGYPCYIIDELQNEHKPSEGVTISQSRRTSNIRQLTPIFTKIHPADERYEHTYRLRHDSSTNEPVLVPVYNFPRPGSFPNRNNLTSPNFSPGFVNSTHAFSGMYQDNSDSSEELIPKDQATHSWSITSGRYLDSTPAAIEMEVIEISKKLSVVDKLRSTLSIPLKDEHHNIDPSRAGTPLQDLPSPFIENFGGIGFNTPTEGPIRTDMSYSQDMVPTIPEVAPVNQHSRNPSDYTHVRQFSFSKYGRPTLKLSRDAHAGRDVEKSVSPDRYERQQRIGRGLILCCLIFPPLWIVVASGGLDPLVSYVTNGEISTVGKSEKRVAAVLGSSLFIGIVVTVVVVAILVL